MRKRELEQELLKYFFDSENSSVDNLNIFKYACIKVDNNIYVYTYNSSCERDFINCKEVKSLNTFISEVAIQNTFLINRQSELSDLNNIEKKPFTEYDLFYELKDSYSYTNHLYILSDKSKNPCKVLSHSHVHLRDENGDPSIVFGLFNYVENKEDNQHLQSSINQLLENEEIGTWRCKKINDEIIFDIDSSIYNLYELNYEDSDNHDLLYKNLIIENDEESTKLYSETCKNFNYLINGKLKKYTNFTKIKTQNTNQIKYLKITGEYITYDEQEDTYHYGGIIMDVTNLISNTKEIEYLAYYDDLTGLLNRKSCYTDLENLTNKIGYGIIIDINNFKRFNDCYGHVAGDTILKEISRILNNIFSISGKCYRVNGDEFFVFLNNPDLNIEKLINRFIVVLEQPLKHKGNKYNVSVSIGIGKFDTDETIDEFFNKIQIAKFMAKRSKSSKYIYANQIVYDEYIKRVTLEKEISDGLLYEQFIPYYQPKVNLNTDEIIGVEALARWKHPIRGYVYPNEFIPVLELNNGIIKLDLLIAKHAIKDLSTWLKNGIVDEHFHISFNFSIVTIESTDIIKFFIKTCKEYNVPYKCLDVEVTETVFSYKTDIISEKLTQIKELGIKVSLDDFSAGHSSVTTLSQYPVDTIKLDKHFLWESNTNGKVYDIFRLVIDIVRVLDTNFIAEGIETIEHKIMLQKNGVKFGQGYFFYKPISYEKATTILKMNRYNSHKLNSSLTS